VADLPAAINALTAIRLDRSSPSCVLLARAKDPGRNGIFRRSPEFPRPREISMKLIDRALELDPQAAKPSSSGILEVV
jgi:hypothetical protein